MALIKSLRPRSKYMRASIPVLICLSVLSILIKTLFLVNESVEPCSKLCPYWSKLTNKALQFSTSHTIRHFPDFVCPQNFRNLADWVYAWPDQFHESLNVPTDSGKSIAPCLPSGSIIYVRIWEIDSFFRFIYPYLINEFVLVTGEGDMSSPTHLTHLVEPNSKIIHWFGQNGQYDVSAYEKFTHLPIGINCFEMADTIERLYSEQPNYTLPSVHYDIDEPADYVDLQDVSRQVLSANVSIQNLVLINFDPGTDGSGLRAKLWRKMCSTKTAAAYPYVTCKRKPSGVQINNLYNIYQRNRQYVFWLSPRGGGIDCHRTWEALYLDIIPIVWNNSLNVLYENLPVLIINDYRELNETYLYKKLYEISNKKLSKAKYYQYEKLRHAYWRRLILQRSRHRQVSDIYQRKNLCWSAQTGERLRRSFGWF